MALPPPFLTKGLVGRNLALPANADNQNTDVAMRLGRYGDQKVESGYPNDHFAADEGSIMVASMVQAQTAIQAGIQSAYVATQVQFLLQNSDPAGGRRLYPKSLRLCVLTVGTSGVDLRYSLVLDNALRTPTTISSGSGGTGAGTAANQTAYRAPAQCTNMDLNPTIAGVPYFTLGLAASVGGATVASPSPMARNIVAQGFIKTTAIVAKDQLQIQFGNADLGGTVQGASASAKIIEHCPPVVIGPGQSLAIHIWSTSNVTAGNAFDDAAFIWAER